MKKNAASLLIIAVAVVIAFFATARTAWQTPEALTRAVALTHADPLMAIEGTDPEALRESLGWLQETMAIVATRYAASEPQSARLLPHIFPFDFLFALAETEEYRQIFLGEPTWQRYGEYERAVARAIRMYAMDLRRSTRIAHQIFASPEARYHFFGASITAEAVFQKLDELKRGIETTRDALTKRRACVRSPTTLCPTILPPLREESPEKGVALPEATKENRALLERDVLPESGIALEQLSTVVLRNDLACLALLGDPLVILPELHERDGIPGSYIHPLNELYFWDAEAAAAQARIPYFEVMVAKGIAFSYQPSASFYFCPDNARVYLHVFTLLKAHETLAASWSRWREEILDERTRAEADRRMQPILTSHHEVSETDVVNAVAYLESLTPAIKDSAVQHEIQKLLLMLKTNSADLHLHINAVVLQSNNYLRGSELGYFRAFSPDYAYLARLPFPLFFLSENPTIVGMQVDMVGEGDHSSLMPHLVPYARVKAAHSDSEIGILLRRSTRYELGLPI